MHTQAAVRAAHLPSRLLGLCLALPLTLLGACVGADEDDAVGGDAGPGGADALPAEPDAAAAEPDAPPPEPVTRCVRGTAGAGLNLRDQPSTAGAVLAVMPEGSQVFVLDGPAGDDAAWYRLDYQGTQGWAHGGFLGECPEPGTGVGFHFLLPWQAGTSFRVSQGHNGGSHTGTGAWAWDFALPQGTPLYAAHGGTVRVVRFDSTYGACDSSAANAANYVVIDRGDGLESLYLHLAHVPAGQEPVAAGQKIDRGALIGYSGQTGWSCGAHLHFQIQRSPGNGGTASWYNPSVNEFFWDTGEAWDPPAGSYPVSQNGVVDIPKQVGSAPPAASVADHFHGHAGPAWDRIMREVAGRALPPRG